MVWLIYVIILLLLLLALFLWAYRKVLFVPSRQRYWKPKQHNNLFLDADSPVVKCYHRKKNPSRDYLNLWHFDRYPNRKVVLYFHGNTGNISHRRYVYDICKRLKFNLLLVDHRGYGESDGKPEVKHVLNDSLVIYDFLRTKYNNKDIIVWGESLGGASAVFLARHRKINRLVLFSTFASPEDIIENMSGTGSWMAKPLAHISKMITPPIPNKVWIQRVTCPVIIIHSLDDKLISYKNAIIMYDAIQHDKKVLLTIQGDHAEPKLTTQKLKKLTDFLGLYCSDDKLTKIIADLSKASVLYQKWKNGKL